MITTAANIARPVTGPSTNSSLRFFAPFIPSPFSRGARGLVRRSASARGLARRSLGGGGRGCDACLPLALELSHVGDDRPPVRGRNGPAVTSHQPLSVRDDVENLPVGVIRDLRVMEGRGGRTLLEENPCAISTSVVA